MKRILMVIGGLLAAAVLAFLGLALSAPAHSHIEVTRTFAAAPQDVYPYVSDLDRWLKWNPWVDMEANQKYTFSENHSGVGAWYSWEGEQTGKGKMSITAATPNEKVADKLEFIEPFAAEAAVSFTLTAEGDKTKVVWAYDADQGLVARGFDRIMGMGDMLTADFNRGFDKLGPMVEADAVARKQAEEAAAAAAAAAEAATADPAEVAAAAGG